MSSNLNFSQCIRGAYDEDKQRLRVDAELSATIIPPPGLEVSISSVDDSIRVVGTEDGTPSGTQHTLRIGPDLNEFRGLSGTYTIFKEGRTLPEKSLPSCQYKFKTLE